MSDYISVNTDDPYSFFEIDADNNKTSNAAKAGNGLIIGINAGTSRYGALFIGNRIVDQGPQSWNGIFSTIVGHNTFLQGSGKNRFTTSLGASNQIIDGDGSVTIGTNNVNNGPTNITIGNFVRNDAILGESIAIAPTKINDGGTATADANRKPEVLGPGNIGIGSGVQVKNNRGDNQQPVKAIAIGYDSKAKTNGTIAIGLNSEADTTNGFALGAYSTTFNDKKGNLSESGYNPSSGTAPNNHIWKATQGYGEISVGKFDGTTTTLSRRIANVAAGVLDADAVNVAQLKAVELKLKDTAQTANTLNLNLKNDTLTVKGDPNITMGIDGTNKAIIAALLPALTGITSITNNTATANSGTVLTFANTGLSLNDKTITGLADGTLSNTSKDAVTGKQLVNSLSPIATALGGGSTIDLTSGTFTAPKFKLKTKTDGSVGTTVGNATDGGTGDTYNSVGEALTSLDNRLANALMAANAKFNIQGDAPQAGNATTGTITLGDTIPTLKVISANKAVLTTAANGDTITITPNTADTTAANFADATNAPKLATAEGVKNYVSALTLAYKVDGDTNAQTTTLTNGLVFKAGMGTTGTTNQGTDIETTKEGIVVKAEADGKVIIGLDEATRKKIDKTYNETTLVNGNNTTASVDNTNPVAGTVKYKVDLAEDLTNVNSLTSKANTDLTLTRNGGANLVLGENTATLTSANAGGTTLILNNDGLSLGKGTKKITGIADGTISNTSTDAITGKQYLAGLNNFVSALGGNAAISDTDGSFTAPSFKLKTKPDGSLGTTAGSVADGGTGETYNNVAAALTALDNRVATSFSSANAKFNIEGDTAQAGATPTGTITLGDTIPTLKVISANTAVLTTVAANNTITITPNVADTNAANFANTDNAPKLATAEGVKNYAETNYAKIDGSNLVDTTGATPTGKLSEDSQKAWATALSKDADINATTANRKGILVTDKQVGAALDGLTLSYKVDGDANAQTSTLSNGLIFKAGTGTVNGNKDAEKTKGGIAIETKANGEIVIGLDEATTRRLNATFSETVVTSGVNTVASIDTTDPIPGKTKFKVDLAENLAGVNAITSKENTDLTFTRHNGSSILLGENTVSLTAGSGANAKALTLGQDGRLSGIADGTQDTDAVNLRQLNAKFAPIQNISNHITRIEQNSYAGTASAIAAANIPHVINSDDRNLFGIGYGEYHGHTAVALGLTGTNKSRSVVWKVTSTFDSTSTWGLGAGLGFTYGPKSSKKDYVQFNVEKFNELYEALTNTQKENEALKSEIESMQEKMAKLEEKLEMLMNK